MGAFSLESLIVRTGLKNAFSAISQIWAPEHVGYPQIEPARQPGQVIALTLDTDICTACGKCEDHCPFLCIEIESKNNLVLKNDQVKPPDADSEISDMFSDVDFSHYEGIQMVKRHPRFKDAGFLNQNRMTALKIEHFNCTSCGICTFHCPTGAIHFSTEQKQTVTENASRVQIFNFFPVDIIW
jgi:ferredoxin